MKEIDPIVEEVIKGFPEYDREDADTYVGSKQYWRSIFEDETNRDPKLHEKFDKLHEDIVTMVIKFCEENGLEDVDEFYVGADGLKSSYGYHEWTSGTDSSMSMRKIKKGPDGWWEREDKNFLFQF